MNSPVDATTADLKNDLRAIVDDTEQLLKGAANSAGEKAGEARTRIDAQLRKLREQIGTLETEAVERAKQAARSTDQAVRAHPYEAIGIAAAVGLLVGFLVARR